MLLLCYATACNGPAGGFSSLKEACSHTRSRRGRRSSAAALRQLRRVRFSAPPPPSLAPSRLLHAGAYPFLDRVSPDMPDLARTLRRCARCCPFGLAPSAQLGSGSCGRLAGAGLAQVCPRRMAGPGCSPTHNPESVYGVASPVQHLFRGPGPGPQGVCRAKRPGPRLHLVAACQRPAAGAPPLLPRFSAGLCLGVLGWRAVGWCSQRAWAAPVRRGCKGGLPAPFLLPCNECCACGRRAHWPAVAAASRRALLTLLLDPAAVQRRGGAAPPLPARRQQGRGTGAAGGGAAEPHRRGTHPGWAGRLCKVCSAPA